MPSAGTGTTTAASWITNLFIIAIVLIFRHWFRFWSSHWNLNFLHPSDGLQPNMTSASGCVMLMVLLNITSQANPQTQKKTYRGVCECSEFFFLIIKFYPINTGDSSIQVTTSLFEGRVIFVFTDVLVLFCFHKSGKRIRTTALVA